jgi:gamma-glutamyltranspeptidase
MPEHAQDSRWAISSPHALSTEAGASAFRDGGNALDAALATAASLTVTLPNNCAIGGDLFALVRDPSGEVQAINASGPAASETLVDDLRRRHGNQMPERGPHTVTVPGLLAGWEAVWSRGARLPWSSIFPAAIAQARDGVPVGRSVARALAKEREQLGEYLALADLMMPGGRPLAPGDILRQAPLGETLEELARQGPVCFYEGEVGAPWLATMVRHGSALTADDLAGYKPEIAKPLRALRGGQEVITAPPNSQGLLLLMILGALECLDPALDPLSAAAPGLAAAFRSAAEARERYLADPRFSEVPVDQLLSNELPSDPQDGGTTATPRSGAGGDTVAVVAADSDGHAVSLIQSLFWAFGSGILDPETGIIAHNRGSFFSLDPESPNMLEGGKRPAHTLMPVLVHEEGELRMVLGTMGGLVQPQVLTHVIQHLRRGSSCFEALAAPRWLVGGLDRTHRVDTILAESGVPHDALAALADEGWPAETLPDFDSETGEAQAIFCHAEGRYSGASDPRSEGLALTG